jgi:hypothetical protein
VSLATSRDDEWARRRWRSPTDRGEEGQEWSTKARVEDGRRKFWGDGRKDQLSIDKPSPTCGRVFLYMRRGGDAERKSDGAARDGAWVTAARRNCCGEDECAKRGERVGHESVGGPTGFLQDRWIQAPIMSGLRTPPCRRQENTSEEERQSNTPMFFGGVDNPFMMGPYMTERASHERSEASAGQYKSLARTSKLPRPCQEPKTRLVGVLRERRTNCSAFGS